MLSGAGGVLSITVVEREDPVDIQALLGEVLQIQGTERLDELHPIVGMVQYLAEVTDPVNYAPYWYSEAPDGWDRPRPAPILLTSGRHDAQTPHRTAEAMAAAGRMPIVAPSMNEPLAHELRQLSIESSPSLRDARTWEGDDITSGLTQWPDNDHYVVFENADAARMYRHFLETALAGEAAIDTNP